MKNGLVSRLKALVVPSGIAPRTIQGGLLKAVRMNLDLTTQTQMYLGLWEREIHGWTRRLCAGIGSALDVGAAPGDYTLFCLMKTSAEQVFAFDPSVEGCAHLTANVSLNAGNLAQHLTVTNKLVGTRNSETECSLDSFLPRVKTPCFVKIDVEGAEAGVLKGATGLLKLLGARWLIETHSLAQENECIDILKINGYSTLIIPNAWWRCMLPELRPIEHNRWLVAARDVALK
jgi:hypothetical protein